MASKQSISLTKQFLEQIAKDMINYVPKGASGQTAKTFKVETTSTGAILYGPSYIRSLATGRGPSKGGAGGGMTLREKIRQWIDDRGISPKPDKNGRAVSKDSLAYMIARKIHQVGTKLFINKGDSGIIKNVLTKERFDAFFESLLEKKTTEVFSPILKEFNELDL